MGKVKSHLESILEASYYNLEYAPSPTYHEAYDVIMRYSSHLDGESRQWCEDLYQKRCIADRHSHD